MRVLQFASNNLTVVAGAAVLFTFCTEYYFSHTDALGSDIVCWIILPQLVRASEYLRERDSTSLLDAEHKHTRRASSSSLWRIAICFTLFLILRAETGLLQCLPLLTTVLLAIDAYREREQSNETEYARKMGFALASSMTACFSTLALWKGGVLVAAISLAVVAPLLFAYTALLSSDQAHWLSRNFEDNSRSLSWRMVTIMVLARGGEGFLHGLQSYAVLQSLVTGFMKALSWYFTILTTQRASWCWANSIQTFSLLTCQINIASTNASVLLALASAVLTLRQLIMILPQSKERLWLWSCFLIPLVLQVKQMRRVEIASTVSRTSFIHELQHPIESLMRNAKAAFETKLLRQSQNYTATYTEYRRRYSIDPPPGFEDWYSFAVANDSPIIDDYDTIYHSISPFWRLSGIEVLDALDKVHALSGSETWNCRFTHEGASTTCSHPDRSFDRHISNLFNRLSDIANTSIPDTEFLVNHLDEPRVLFPEPAYDHAGKVDVEQHSHSPTWNALTKFCSHERRNTSSIPDEIFGLPFITDLRAHKNLCLHPEYKKMHGMLASPNSLPLIRGFVPVLSTTALSTMGDIIFPSPAYMEDEFRPDKTKFIPWEKMHNELYWRGSTTGGYANANEWKSFHRQRFVTLAQNLEGKLFAYLQDQGHQVLRFGSRYLNKGLFNVAFTSVKQCAWVVCLSQFVYFKPSHRVDRHRAIKSRLVFDLDGNGMSGRFYSLLASPALPLKQTLFREWHDDRLVPWVHYVPVSLGMMELPEMVSWLTDNERGQEIAREIAEMGQQWHSRSLREIDMVIYVYRLLLELARLQDRAREAHPE